MVTLSDYMSGTISLANGSVTVTGTGTLFEVTRFREGDTLQIQNLTAVIASVDSNTQLTLAEPWTGASIVNGPYRARQLGDGSRVSTQAATIIELLGNGVLANIAELGVEEGKAPVGGPTGEYELQAVVTDPNGSLRNLAALTLGGRQILQTDGSGSLTAITLATKQILQTDANGALTPLALVANKQLVTNGSAQVSLADDKSTKTISTVAVATPVAYIDVSLPSGYECFDLVLNYLIPSTNAVALGLQFSTDNGATFFTGSDYRSSAISVTSASTGAFGGAMIATNLVVSNDISNIHGVSSRISIHPGSSAGRPAMSAVTGVQASFGYKVQIYAGSLLTVFQRVTTIRVFFSSGNISSGRVTLIGAING
ncbi:hypothetical protein JAU75_19315 [Ochrobactrum sp. Q0168]|uniref:hypothetical protein n=1 Tax=Ochrobactrum sp. Q0168 TaxID=2793241 RepID=UPI0018ED40EB|nr:hypothetical protein [Ochrobactrum sp. Q0168]